MTILIPLPHDSGLNTYKAIKSYLKQVELAIHHAQKSVENSEKDGFELSDDNAYVHFRHPQIDQLKVKDFDGQNYYDELQDVAIEINLE